MSDYPGFAQRWTAGADRQVGTAPGVARTAVLQTVRALGFTPTAEQFTFVTAERGSRLGGLSLTRTRVPVSLRVDLTGNDSGTELVIRVEDRWAGAAGSKGAAAVYGDVFTEVLSAFDAALKQLDPKAAASFGLWWRVLPEDEAVAGRGTAEAAARIQAAVARRTSRLLEGPRKRPTGAAASAGLDAVVFHGPDSYATLAADVVDGMLTAGQLVAAAPGGMPPALVAQLHTFVARLEREMDVAAQVPTGHAVQFAVSQDEIPVVSFLYQQAALRERLPVRLLCTCTTCRLERVVNPDLAKLRERNRRIKVLSSSVGTVIGSHHISPFILVGRLSQLNNNDPDFVCNRCQGTDANEKPVTFCPRCGERRDESVLRVCGRCKLDLRTLLPTIEVWSEITAAPVPAPLPMGMPDPMDLPPSYAEVAADIPQPAAEAYEPPIAVAPAQPWAGTLADMPVAELGWDANAAPYVPPPDTPIKQAGWYADPAGRHEVRYWDGWGWTYHVSTSGVAGYDDPL